MKRSYMALAVVAFIALAAALAKDTPAKPKPATTPAKVKVEKPQLRGTHAQMATVCQLSKKQVTQIIELNQARREALASLEKKFKAIKDQLAAALKTKDTEASKKAQAELLPLAAKHKKILGTSRAEVMAVLLPEQRAMWDRYMTLRNVLRRLPGAELTKEQHTKVEVLYDELAVGVNMSDPKARKDVVKKLFSQVEKEILTDKQRAAVAKAKKDRKDRKRRPKPVTTKKAGPVKVVKPAKPTEK